MDQQKLRSLVFDKTGVKIDIDDPIFALVALNEAVLEEAVGRHVALIDAASLELARQARLAGGLPASPAQPAPYTPAPATPVRAIATQAPLVTPRELRLLCAAAGIAVLSALIVLGGQSAFRKAAPVIEQAKSLTPEQTLALQNADKLTKAIQKLDPKTRAQLQAELQK